MASYLQRQKELQQRIAETRAEIDNYYANQRARFEQAYLPRIESFRSKLAEAEERNNPNLVQFYRENIESQQEKLESAYQMIEDRAESFAQKRMERIDYLNRLMDDPAFEAGVERERAQVAAQQAQAEAAKIAEQRRVAAEQARVEREVSQREQAERQAGRFRARGSRAAGRPMLSAARMSPEQLLAPSQSLGAFMPK